MTIRTKPFHSSFASRLASLFGPVIVCVTGHSLPASAAPEQEEARSDTATAEAGDAGSNRGISPPQLLTKAGVEYPDSGGGQEAAVVLTLTIERDGTVSEATVAASAGAPFDEAALEASRRLLFVPARVDGRAVRAKIRYEVLFSPPLENDHAKPASSPGPQEELATEAVAPPNSEERVSSVRAASPNVDLPIADEGVVAVVVEGRRSEADELQQSAHAVTVVDTRKAQQRSDDMGEVLARTQGVSVRRQGGLGSETRFALAGLHGDQIRFFLDGVPLDIAGFPLGVGNVPVGLVERVEIYRGVVPVRLGADALGGAVNLVTDQSYKTRAVGSYQVGSYGVLRTTLAARYREPTTGFVAAANAWGDWAKNNYPVDVTVADASGRVTPVTVPRFHDRYHARGAAVELGVVGVPWARRLLVKGFASAHDKEIQHDLVMSDPYGEVRRWDRVQGVTVHYDADLGEQVSVEAVANFSHRQFAFEDLGEWIYNWRGERVRARRDPGEIGEEARDERESENTVFFRGTIEWQLAKDHWLRASTAPTHTSRTGEDRAVEEGDPDPLAAQRTLFKWVNGVEYESHLLGDCLSAILFGKQYTYAIRSDELVLGDIRLNRDRDVHELGYGGALRATLASGVMLKASFERATRLPPAYQVFGTGQIDANLQLSPEKSDNANVGLLLEREHETLGMVAVDSNGFLRNSDDLIVPIAGEVASRYDNLSTSRTVGWENALEWRDPRRWVHLGGTMTWQDARNQSTKGAYEAYKGDRVANQPYAFGSWFASLRWAGLPGPSDSIEPYYQGRWVHGFFRTWESLGSRDSKATIPSQTSHGVGVTWVVNRGSARISSSIEVQNLTDAKLYDNYGVPRPGRTFALKSKWELH